MPTNVVTKVYANVYVYLTSGGPRKGKNDVDLLLMWWGAEDANPFAVLNTYCKIYIAQGHSSRGPIVNVY